MINGALVCFIWYVRAAMKNKVTVLYTVFESQGRSDLKHKRASVSLSQQRSII